jgi:acetyl-CoA carboxylase carboxyl transferase subunit beta
MDTGADRLVHDIEDTSGDDDLSLTCPACGADLVHDHLFLEYRVCADCGRHFSMTARERVGLIVDEGSYRDIRESPSLDEFDNDQISALDRIADLRERPVLDEAIVIGTGKIGGTRAVVIALDDQYVSAQIGALGAEKIIMGLEHAHTRRLPVVAVVAGGGAGVQAGPLAAVQGARIASVAAQVRRDGIPMVAVLTHPTSASVFNTVASQADVIFAEPGTHVGVMWSSGPSLDDAERALSEGSLVSHGWIDGVIARPDLRQHLDDLLGLMMKKHGDANAARGTAPVAEGDADAASSHGVHLTRLLSPFIEIRGDRVETDDRHVICGIGRLEDHIVAIAVQDPSVSMPDDERPALRKVQRIAHLAGRFEIPMILVVDAPGKRGPSRVTPGESLAAAKLGNALAMLPVSVISVGTGKVHGIAGSVMMSGDRRLMLEQSTYHLPISGAARGGRLPNQAAGQYWSARECERLGLIDTIIEEPPAGASNDPSLPARLLRTEMVYLLTELSRVGPRRLVENRQRRHRVLGQETEAGLAAIRGELRDWQEVQQSVAKSIEDWRDRVGQRMASQPRLSFQRPDLGEIAARLKARQEELRHELLERTGRNDRSNE